MLGYQDLRQRHVAGLMAMMPEMVQRLGWPPDRIRREREDRLRDGGWTGHSRSEAAHQRVDRSFALETVAGATAIQNRR